MLVNVTYKIRKVFLIFLLLTIFPTNYFPQEYLYTDTLHILPLGNSITFDKRSKDTRASEDQVGYRYPLYKKLNGIGLVYDFIGSEHSGSNFLTSKYDANGGFPGIKDNELANLLRTGTRIQPPNTNEQITPGPYLETYLPDLILLHIGTNGNQFANGTSASDIEDILNLVDSVENSSGKEIYVVVAKIINRVPNETFVDELNYNIDSMVTDRVTNPSNSSYPDKVIIVDMEYDAGIIYAIDSMGTVGDEIIGDMNDHYHPNDKGYLKMSQIWFDAIKNIFPKPFNIIKQPIDFATKIDSTATFSIHVNYSEPISFQWKRNGSLIQGATDSIYITSLLTLEDNNTKYNCEIRSKHYIVNSDTATLFVFDSTSRVTTNLVAEYNFEEGEGTTINNINDKFPDLNLKIKNQQAIEWIPYGLKINSSPEILTVKPAKDILEEIIKTNEITLEAWIQPSNNIQVGPASIVTISKNTSERNITLGQDADKFEISLRTSLTDNNGKPSLYSSENKAYDALVHIIYTRKNNGDVNLYINGELDNTFNIDGNFTNWDSTYHLSLGNELTNNKLWQGRFYLLGIYNRALSQEEILHNYNIKFNGYGKLLFAPTNLEGFVANDTSVVLTWDDNEISEKGYIIERKANSQDSIFKVLDSVAANTTEYIDDYPKYQTSYVYRVKAYNHYSESNYSSTLIINGLDTVLHGKKNIFSFKLYQNYPNPFNPTTNIQFTIAKKSMVQIKVFNALGETVRIIYSNKTKLPGNYYVKFDGGRLGSGVYFYQMIAEPLDGSQIFIQGNKALLLK